MIYIKLSAAAIFHTATSVFGYAGATKQQGIRSGARKGKKMRTFCAAAITKFWFVSLLGLGVRDERTLFLRLDDLLEKRKLRTATFLT